MKKQLKPEGKNYQLYLNKSKELYQKPLFKASFNLGLTLLVVTFFALFAVKPTIKTIINLRKDLKENQRVKDSLEKKITDLNKAKTTYGQISEDLHLIDMALPKQADFKTLAAQINYLTYSNKLTLLSASYGGFSLIDDGLTEITKKKQVKGPANSLEFNLTITGSLTNIRKFLGELEQLERLIQIKSVGFSPKSSQNELTLNLNCQAFWLENKIEN
ncbi:hypothetical protein COT75_02265 [Candidatus Beckwithbacteria bacterium CG10_big_fil_rev_8_21_14_0_10_34_10]|uniref:Uncharacterized protein n=1 Tax=Candidatus Beckwithbacteria bacterium CG10_big_fil_rev_8_21_14_0_10_34_10 TaxID=1974495 RepID=A0A2H0WBK1_9BACT|nr:MAG: hypothetical protein COT75_02265 [Candidatus Beckwithbacteria bacterium CG10_big_fil_rev_8_21_14_0_10_34_10]